MGSGRSTHFLIISIALVLSALSVVAVIVFIIFERWKHKKKVELAKQIEQEEEQQEKRKKAARKRKVKNAVEDYLKSQLETGVVATVATTQGSERWDAIAGQPAKLRRGISVTAENKSDVNEAVRKMSEVSKELDAFGG
ncbi:unnamed protein product [Angiostrongylus costaricensis]|uniref:Uncharacterized protein n=1 Tax=Angiostrongylus costaricensis TaxID=334426 RepID=A0A0R3Q0C5_ANGCS|nr:unnamed protein product [Angiostrongylus costaricensis]